VQLRLAVFPVLPGKDFAAQLMSHQLHSVTDAQHRDAQLEQAGIGCRSSLFVDAGGASAQDDAAWIAGQYLFEGRVIGEKLAVDVALADPARDELAVLRSEVQHHDALFRSGDVLQLQVPCPTFCARWWALPSLGIAGAMTISAVCISRMVRFPQ